jgi:predicted nucleic acid-binding protein
MALVCCDTSFLFSLYVTDAHTPRATALLRRLGSAIAISPLSEYEFSNAVRLSVYRGLRTPEQASLVLAAFEADLAAGLLFLPVYSLATVLVEAKRLSSAHTQRFGFRSFDILHVAAAIVAGGTLFLTFDEQQKQLASVAGLRV